MVLIPDIGAALGQTIFGEGGKPYSDPNRVPMAFTSLRRLRASGLDTTARIGGEGGIIPDITSISDLSIVFPNTAEVTVIEMAVNPNSIGFRQPKRITKRDTQEGSVFFHFTNSRGENNDILTLDFSGNTGNIDSRSDIVTDTTSVFSTQAGVNTGANKKLSLWHNLWQLTREPMLLEDNTRNEFLIVYSSVAIPIQISLIGHWSNVLEFTDNADKPFSRDYSMSFTVEEIVPPLDELTSLIQEFAVDTTTTAGLT